MSISSPTMPTIMPSPCKGPARLDNELDISGSDRDAAAKARRPAIIRFWSQRIRPQLTMRLRWQFSMSQRQRGWRRAGSGARTALSLCPMGDVLSTPPTIYLRTAVEPFGQTNDDDGISTDAACPSSSQHIDHSRANSRRCQTHASWLILSVAQAARPAQLSRLVAGEVSQLGLHPADDSTVPAPGTTFSIGENAQPRRKR